MVYEIFRVFDSSESSTFGLYKAALMQAGHDL